MIEEIWKEIPSTEGLYMASSLGNIKSLDRTYIDSIGRQTTKKGKILTLCKKKCGYLYVCIRLSDRKNKNVRVHRAVALTFIENKENKPVVNHIDGNKENNNITNLEWVTHRENNNHYKSINPEKFSSPYIGVRIYKGVISSHISIEGREYSLGNSETEEEAHEKYKIALENWLNLKQKPLEWKYDYVSFNKRKGRYDTYLRDKDLYYFVGSYETKEEAINERENIVEVYKETGIFPTRQYASKYKGVSFKKNLNKWQATVKTPDGRKYIGVYENEDDAAAEIIKYLKVYNLYLSDEQVYRDF